MLGTALRGLGGAAGGAVEDPDASIGLVAVLTAGAGGAERVDIALVEQGVVREDKVTGWGARRAGGHGIRSHDRRRARSA